MFKEKQYLLECLESLLNIPSVTGDTDKIVEFIKRKVDNPKLCLEQINKGGLIITLPGVSDKCAITVSAHVDTLGGMVNSIKASGTLEITQIGGYDWNSIEGENCIVHGATDYTGTITLNKTSVHVHGGESSKTTREQSSLELRLDEKVATKEDVENLGINVGDFVSFDPRTVITPKGFVKSRHLDDKAGVAIVMSVLNSLIENNITPAETIHFLISAYEEVGHGSSYIPQNTTQLIAVDMGVVGGNQQGSEFHVSICAKDSSGPYDLNMRKSFVDICNKQSIPYKIDVYPFYGSDASAALRAGHNIKAGLIGPGVLDSHSYERTHVEALEACHKLLYAYLTK